MLFSFPLFPSPGKIQSRKGRNALPGNRVRVGTYTAIFPPSDYTAVDYAWMAKPAKLGVDTRKVTVRLERSERKLKKPSKTIFFLPIFVNAKPYFVKKPPTF